MTIEEILKLKSAGAPDKNAYKAVKDHWDKVSKPLDAMGDFEDIICRIGSIQGLENPKVSKNIILTFCSDNGIVDEGVSQCDRSITALCSKDIADGKKSVNVMAKANNIDVLAIDVGIEKKVDTPNIRDCNIRRCSRNFLKERAMTEEETKKAIKVGLDLVRECRKKGYDLIGIGEMGIGNTTTSSAVAAALLMLPASEVTGKGAGLSGEGLIRKVSVVREAIDKYDLYGAGTLEVLSAVGGYDIAAMAGVCIGGAVYKMPIVLDGVISNVAALVAERLLRGTREYLIASHKSGEDWAEVILKELNLKPVIDAKMALGEGTGAVMMISLIKTAYEVFSSCSDFETVGMEAYTHFDEE